MAASVSIRPAAGAPAVQGRGLLLAATIGGALLLLGGALCLLLYLAWPLLETRSTAQVVTPDEAISQAAEFGVLGVSWVGVGAALLWQVTRAWQGRPAPRFRTRRGSGLLALLVFLLALAAGVAALALPHRAAGYLFPLPALLAVLTPPLLVISLVQRAGWPAAARRAATPAGAASALPAGEAPGMLPGRTSREDPFAADLVRRIVGPPTSRRVLGALAWGLAGASSLALVLELLALVGGLALGWVVLTALGQTAQLNGWLDALQGQVTGDCAQLQSIFGNPWVPIGATLAFAGVVPLIEEPAKSLAAVWLRGRLGAARDALLYGAAAGVGFGMLESAVYNVGDVHTWWGTAATRLGTTFIHALATGLFGVAWYYRLQRRERGRFWRYALAAVGVHGLWNASVIGIMTLSALRICSTDPIDLVMSNDPARFIALAVPALLIGGAAVTLVVLARRLGPAELVPAGVRPL